MELRSIKSYIGRAPDVGQKIPLFRELSENTDYVKGKFQENKKQAVGILSLLNLSNILLYNEEKRLSCFAFPD